MGGAILSFCATAKGFRVYASKQPLEGNDYTMDRSTFIYLMDPQGGYAAHLSGIMKQTHLAASYG